MLYTSGRNRRVIKQPLPENRLTPDEVEAELEKWSGLIYKIALKWTARCGHRVPIEDMRQEVLAGFVDAARRFDKSLGYSFSTYAQHWGDHYAQNLCGKERSGGMRVPNASRTKDNPLVIPFSIDHASGDPDWVASGSIPDRPPNFDDDPEFPPDFWSRMSEVLDERRAKIIQWRYRQGMTLTQCSERLGISRERIRQIEAQALERLANFSRLLDGVDVEDL